VASLLVATAMALSLAGVTGGVDAGAHNQTSAQFFQCIAYPNTNQAGPQEANQTLTFQVNAVDNVVFNTNYTTSIIMDPITVPTDFSGIAVNNIRDVYLKFPVPTNATYQSVSLSPSGGGWSVSQSGGIITIASSNTYGPGQVVTPPTINLVLKATGATFSQIPVRLGGSPNGFNNVSNPSYHLTANVNAPVIGALDVDVRCYADGAPPQSLHTTLIVPPDVIPPSATITVPASGGT